MMGIQTMSRGLRGASSVRGLLAARAEAEPSLADIQKMVEALNRTFTEFKAENDKQLADKLKDVVQSDKVDRINDELGKLQKAVDETNAQLAAARLGGAAGEKQTPEQKAYGAAFNKYFRKGVEDNLRELEVKAAATSDSDPGGGYTATPEMETTMDRVLSAVSSMRGLATVRPISRGTYKKLVGQGGAGAGWVAERESRTETATSTLAELEFPAMELYANPAATQTLLDDSAVDIGAWLGDEVASAFAEQEGAAFITGNGIGKPRGVLSYATVANASYVWGKLGYIATGVAAAIYDSTHNGVDALLDLVYGLKKGYRQNATFLMNRVTQGAVRKLKNATSGDYLWAPPQVNGVQGGQPATLAGYPIADDDNMSDIGANAYPIAFGDFRRGYLIVDRIGIRVLRDPYTNKPYVMFYTTKRVGGGVQNFEAIKLLKVATS